MCHRKFQATGRAWPFLQPPFSVASLRVVYVFVPTSSRPPLACTPPCVNCAFRLENPSIVCPTLRENSEPLMSCHTRLESPAVCAGRLDLGGRVLYRRPQLATDLPFDESSSGFIPYSALGLANLYLETKLSWFA